MRPMSINARTPPPIGAAERAARLDGLRCQMGEAGVDAVLLGATSSLRYFTGFAWHPSERFCGAIVHADRVDYVVPCFELEKVSQLIGVPGEVLTWEEDEDPYRLIARQLGAKARLGLDDQIALFMFQRLRRAMGDERLADAGAMIKQAAPAQIRR
jgi:Xaa-Pro dipeptidase